MDALCREAIRTNRPFDRPFERSSHRTRDRHPERLSDRRQHRSSDRSSNRTHERERNRSCDRILDHAVNNKTTAIYNHGYLETSPGLPFNRRPGDSNAPADIYGIHNERIQGITTHNETTHALNNERTQGRRNEYLQSTPEKAKAIPERANDIYNDPKIAKQRGATNIENIEESPILRRGVASRKEGLVRNADPDGRSDSEDSADDEDGDEVCVWVDDKQLWVSGVNSETTCGELVKALLPHQRNQARTKEDDWVITEMWRSMEQPLNNEATILDIWNAWGDAQNEIRLNLRYVDSSGDSGRGSPPSPRPSRRRASRHCQRRQLFPQLIRAQGDTLQKQADRLREQDRQISQLEEQTHRTRMAKHGPNYLLESYLRDIAKHSDLFTEQDTPEDQIEQKNDRDNEGKKTDAATSIVQTGEANDSQARSSEATDSPAANSDSGVGVSGSPPRLTKRRSRGRHLLREHYLTKELADICQINANRIQTKSDDTSETSSDELSRIQQQIDILEKLAIVNKRLQREEELIVRLGVKLRRYLCEDQISYIESEEQIVSMLNTVRKQMEDSSKEIESNAIEMERADYQLEKRKNLLDILSKEIDDVERESHFLEVQATQVSGLEVHRQTTNNVQYVTNVQSCDESRNYNHIPLDVSNNQYVDVNYGNTLSSNYPLDTLV